MKQKVSLVKEYHYDRQLFGDLSELEFLVSETAYNEQGKVVTLTSYFKDGIPEQRISNEYDSKGRIISETVEYLLEDVSEKTLFEYDEKDRIISEKKVYADSSFDLVTHKFDDAAFTNTTTKYDSEGAVEKVEKAVYDAHGNLLGVTRHDGDQKELYSEKFEYNEQKKPTLHWINNSEQNISGGNIYLYDENGALVEVKRLNAKGNEIASEKYVTDEKGNILGMHEQDHMQGREHLAFESQYDENGRMLLRVHYTTDGTPERRESYVYDEDGHVVEETHFHLETRRGLSEHYTRRYEYEFF
jgi:hypothetical protein